MNPFKAALSSSRSIRLHHSNQRLSSLLPRPFSTEAEPQNQDSVVNSVTQEPNPDFRYGRLVGITKYTTRSDVCNLMDGCHLNPDDIRVEYNRSFAPVAIHIQFPSKDSYEAGLKSTIRDRLHRLDPAPHSAWGSLPAYQGKVILLKGIPRAALVDDVERFLSGCQYDSSSLKMFYASRGIGGPPGIGIRVATVSFPSQAAATHASITKDRGFCLNEQISVRVLQ